MDWQPIDTAPKDGRWVLVFAPGFNTPQVARYAKTQTYEHGQLERNDEGWQLDQDSFFRPKQPPPTHWMALPEPPNGR